MQTIAGLFISYKMKIEHATNNNDPFWFWLSVILCTIISIYFVVQLYLDDINYIFPIMWGICSSYGIYYAAYAPYQITLTENEIQYKTLCGKVKTFSLQDITFTEEYEIKENKEQHIILKLHFPKYRFRIEKNYNLQYQDIYNYCKKNLRREYVPRKEYRYFTPLFWIIGVLIAHFTLVFYINSQKLQGSVKIQGTYRTHDFHKPTKGRSNYVLELYLKEYPSLRFGSWDMERQKKEQVDSILKSRPHTFIFTISRDDYEKKIKKSIPMNFYDKYQSRYFIEVYEDIHEISTKNRQKIFAKD